MPLRKASSMRAVDGIALCRQEAAGFQVSGQNRTGQHRSVVFRIVILNLIFAWGSDLRKALTTAVMDNASS